MIEPEKGSGGLSLITQYITATVFQVKYLNTTFNYLKSISEDAPLFHLHILGSTYNFFHSSTQFYTIAMKKKHHLLGYFMKKCRSFGEDIFDSVKQDGILRNIVTNADQDLSVTVIFKINGSSFIGFSHRPVTSADQQKDERNSSFSGETTPQSCTEHHSEVFWLAVHETSSLI